MWPEPNEEQVQQIIRTSGGNSAFHNFHNDYGHIEDANVRRRLVLAEIDKIPFSWYHVRAVSVAGIGFFSASYSLFAINVAIPLLGMAYWQEDGGKIPKETDTAIKAATAGGTVVGQVVFGWLADVVGRKRMYGVELLTILVSTVAQSLTSSSVSISITGTLILWRVLMGIGVGGDYPMSAVITSEFAPTKWRGSMMAAVFSMQGMGQLVAALVALIVTVAFRDSFLEAHPADCGPNCQAAADRAWRIIIGAGAVPALLALYYRMTIPETPRYTFDVNQDLEKGDADVVAFKAGKSEGHPNTLLQESTKLLTSNNPVQPRASWSDFREYFGNWKNGSLLFATMSCWFFLDLAFYGLGLNNMIVLESIGYGTSTESIYHTLFNTAVGSLIIVCAGSLPGYWLSVVFMDTLGRRPIQIWGFAILTALFCIIGFAYHSLGQASLLVLYVLAQFFFNFGPNTTTFIVPGECFPTRYRALGHGLSAAAGKVGALIAQYISQILLTKDRPADCKGNACSPWLPHLMEIFACFMLCGTLISLIVPETKRRTLEEIAGEKPLENRNSTSSAPAPRKPSFLSPYLSPILSPMRRYRLKAKSGGSSPVMTAASVSSAKKEKGKSSAYEGFLAR